MLTYTCQVCGKQGNADHIQGMAESDQDFWQVHHIERDDGIVIVMTCNLCRKESLEMIFESYTKRIRKGLVPGFQ